MRKVSPMPATSNQEILKLSQLRMRVSIATSRTWAGPGRMLHSALIKHNILYYIPVKWTLLSRPHLALSSFTSLLSALVSRNLIAPFPIGPPLNSKMLLTTGYPVMMFGGNIIPLSHRGDPSFGIMPSSVRSFDDLKSIVYGQNSLPLKDKVKYSMLVTFAQPSADRVKKTLEAIKDPKHQLHSALDIPGSNELTFWMEMHVTTAGGHRLANLCMPLGMGEAAALNLPQTDFNVFILGQALSWLYENSRKNLGITDTCCVIPLAEIRVRDIVSYRNLKLALQMAKIQDIAIRADNVEGSDRLEVITQPILAFCAVCIKLSTTHRRCGGCKVSLSHYLENSLTQLILMLILNSQIAHYCSAQCQKGDWTKLHKNECKAIQKEQKDWNEALRASASS